MFVRFAKEEVAQRAVQKMDGMEIKGFKLAVSLAKFRRNFGSSKKVVVQTKEQSLRWRKKESAGNRVDGRSFKDIVAGSLQMNSQPRECQRQITTRKKVQNVETKKEEPMKLVQGIGIDDLIEWLQGSALEEVKRKIGVVIEEVIDAFQRDVEPMAGSCLVRKKGVKMQVEGGEKKTGVFLEEDLILSMGVQRSKRV